MVLNKQLAYYINRTKELERQLNYLKYIKKKQEQEIMQFKLLLSIKIGDRK